MQNTHPAPRSIPRLAADVGGTFTDIALEIGQEIFTSKVLTTPTAPEEGVIEGVKLAVEQAGIAVSEIGLFIHGTTLATNALIERKGAEVVLITTEGHRDSVEMAQENRFEQYDINIDRPTPLVERYRRWSVKERMNFKGEVLVPLDEESVRTLIPALKEQKIGAVAIGLLHAYANDAHERRVAEILQEALPDLAITLSSEVCPEIREYERQSTACANAYVQPKMAGYLKKLDAQMRADGFQGSLLLMTSGGGLTTLETAIRFPIRLVESGPAGGAILANEIAKECDMANVLSFDMGGTTAKICMIDDFTPLQTRTFEVARAYRNKKGSGLPVRIPAIEMVEIGAGGGSIAHVDGMGRLQVGPKSAGSEPGPVCYGRGGTDPTVTDGDLVLGKIDPEHFAGGSVSLAVTESEAVVAEKVGKPLALEGRLAGFAIAEIVDENMANAARVHAIEWGKDISARSMIAFGGAAPLHAARLAEKLKISNVVIPTGAGVGSAIGFLRAPISYEVVRSRYMKVAEFDVELANALISSMQEEARAIVEAGAPGEELTETRTAFMRYIGQGHEIAVTLPAGRLEAKDADVIREAFLKEYRALYGQEIPGQEPEILSWTLGVAAPQKQVAAASPGAAAGDDAGLPEAIGVRPVFDPTKEEVLDHPLYRRESLGVGQEVSGPALIIEDQTTTVVTSAFNATINELGYIVLSSKSA